VLDAAPNDVVTPTAAMRSPQEPDPLFRTPVLEAIAALTYYIIRLTFLHDPLFPSFSIDPERE
jgi:hypothetical protein